MRLGRASRPTSRATTPQAGGCEGAALVHSRRSAEDGAIAPLADVARFRPDDPDALVWASLACPVCLRSDGVAWAGALDGYDPSIECECGFCQREWSVYLAPEQALRLGLMASRTI